MNESCFSINIAVCDNCYNALGFSINFIHTLSAEEFCSHELVFGTIMSFVLAMSFSFCICQKLHGDLSLKSTLNDLVVRSSFNFIESKDLETTWNVKGLVI
jgi:hypothetical protein